eukprot:5399063-Pleurochrysis_carterae.AAC.1
MVRNDVRCAALGRRVPQKVGEPCRVEVVVRSDDLGTTRARRPNLQNQRSEDAEVVGILRGRDVCTDPAGTTQLVPQFKAPHGMALTLGI